MKSLLLIFFCLLVTAFHFSTQNITASSLSSPISLRGRRVLQGLSLSFNKKDEYQEVKVMNEKRKLSTIQDEFMEFEIPKDAMEEDEFAYHVDYHGVTTHPNPTPKHPKP